MVHRIAIAAVFLCGATPAAANAAAQVSEGGGAALFALGIAGVLIGRRLSMGSKGED